VNLANIKLLNFRGYDKREFEFNGSTIVVGENGAGKSNLLEVIYLLATGKSFRADSDSEMIKYGNLISIVEGLLGDGTELKVILSDATTGNSRKKFEVNGIPRRMIDFIGKFKAVLFTPQDMELINGSPSIRRKYLDFIITQNDREYRRCLISYEKGLRQRNKLLEMIREGLAQRSQLYFWDKLLIKNGEYLTRSREDYLIGLEKTSYQAVYDKSIISESRIKQYEVEEVASATTLVGPHRDDFRIMYEDKDVSKYGSRGQQRMGILWLKQGELNFLNSEARPVLLLDDIFSELDHKHRQDVMDLVTKHLVQGGQVVMTSADEHLIPPLPDSITIQL
jgi:DNA replication and repair protein RecF